MATTFKNMQDDVLLLTQELQGKTDFNLVVIKRQINRGCRNFIKDTDCIFDILSFTTVANQLLYDSSDFANFAYAYKIVEPVKYITDSSAEFGKILLPYPGGRARLPKNLAHGEPEYYYTLGMSSNNKRQIGTYPVIDVSSETLEVPVYRYQISDLSLDASEPEFDDEYREAPIFYAVWKIFSFYSHLSPSWRAKAIEHKQLYDEVVLQFKFNNLEDDLGQQQVTDVYADY